MFWGEGKRGQARGGQDVKANGVSLFRLLEKKKSWTAWLQHHININTSSISQFWILQAQNQGAGRLGV